MAGGAAGGSGASTAFVDRNRLLMMSDLPRFVRPLLIAAVIAVGVYLLTDGKFLFVPILFLPALPLFRRRPETGSGQSSSGSPQSKGSEETQGQLPPPPHHSGSRADPRWN
jgi:hypothetical protein